MKLKRLRIENIATYLNQEIDFEDLDYPVFVTGKTGAGKTTLFIDAITAALFGSAYGRKEREYGKILVMRGKKIGKIFLEFEIGGKTYRVERVFSEGSGSQAKLVEVTNGVPRLITTSIRAVDTKIKELTGLTFDILVNSAMVRQGDVYKFLRASPSERRNMLVDVLKINLEALREASKEKRKLIENKLRIMQEKINMIKEDISKKNKIMEEIDRIRNVELPRLKKSLESVENDIKEIQSSINSKNRELENLRAELGRLEELEKHYRKALSESKHIQEQIRNVEQALKMYGEEILLNINRIMDRIHSYNLLRLELERVERDISIVEDKLCERDELEQLKREKEFYVKKADLLEKKNKELRDIDKLISVLQAKKSEIQKHLGALESAEAFCPVCGAKLTKETKEKRRLELLKELEKIDTEINKNIVIKQELEREAEELKKFNDKLKEIETKINIIQRKLGEEDLDSEYKQLRENRNEIIEKIKNQENELNAIMNAMRVDNINQLEKIITELRDIYSEFIKYDDLKKKLIKISSDLRAYEEELLGKDKLVQRYQKLKSDLNLAESKLNKLRAKKEKLIREISENEQKLKDKLDKLEEIKRKERNLRDLLKEKEKLEIDLNAYTILESQIFATGALPTRLLDEYLRIIERYANDYLSRVFHQDIEIRFHFKKTRGSQQSIELKSYSSGFERKIETFSGGEQTLIGFAIRLAIGKLLAQVYAQDKRPRFLIIDEGFGPLDEELRLTVAEALRNLKNNREFDQIIVISHQQELKYKPIFKTIIEIEKDFRNISRVREINQA